MVTKINNFWWIILDRFSNNGLVTSAKTTTPQPPPICSISTFWVSWRISETSCNLFSHVLSGTNAKPYSMLSVEPFNQRNQPDDLVAYTFEFRLSDPENMVWLQELNQMSIEQRQISQKTSSHRHVTLYQGQKHQKPIWEIFQHESLKKDSLVENLFGCMPMLDAMWTIMWLGFDQFMWTSDGVY